MPRKLRKQYVLADIERERFILGLLAYCLATVGIAVMCICGAGKGMLPVWFAIVLPAFFLGSGCYAVYLGRYRFAAYVIRGTEVTLTAAGKERRISLNAETCLAVFSFTAPRRYYRKSTRYLVLWERGTPLPEPGKDATVVLAKYNVILLPHTEQVLRAIREATGITQVPTHPGCA